MAPRILVAMSGSVFFLDGDRVTHSKLGRLGECDSFLEIGRLAHRFDCARERCRVFHATVFEV